MNNKELFFYLIEYLCLINIIEYQSLEGIVDNKYNKEQIKNEENKKDYEPKNINNINKGELSQLNIEKINEKINLDPETIFLINNNNKKIKFSDLKMKLNNFYIIFFSFMEYKKQIPEFESEYFYYFQIKYFLDTILFLDIDKFELKILDLVDMKNLTQFIKDGQVKDINIKYYYYYAICEETELNYLVLNSIKNFNLKSLEERKEEFKNIRFDINKTKNEATFIMEDNQITIQNPENLIIDEKLIIKLMNHRNVRISRSLTYFLNNEKFSKSKGDKFWESFLKSNIVEDIIKHFYKYIPSNIFKDEKIIKIFKENSFYFPLNIENYALSKKETFKMYFGPNKENLSTTDKKEKGKLWKIIDEAFYKIRIMHEWFHICQAFLYFSIENNNIFDSPKRIIKIKGEDKESNKDGEIVEILLFGRIIYELHFNEVIFILDDNNYNMSIEDFREHFLKIRDEDNFKIIDKFLLNNKKNEEFINDGLEQYKYLLENKIINKSDI